MYGTVARLRIKPGKADEARRLAREEADEASIPGFLFQHLYQMDEDSNVCYLAVGFESKDAYVANARSPEQHERYLQLRALLEADPEWHDGEIILSSGPAG